MAKLTKVHAGYYTYVDAEEREWEIKRLDKDDIFPGSDITGEWVAGHDDAPLVILCSYLRDVPGEIDTYVRKHPSIPEDITSQEDYDYCAAVVRAALGGQEA